MPGLFISASDPLRPLAAEVQFYPKRTLRMSEVSAEDCLLQPIERTLHAPDTLFHMRVDHRGFEVPVAEK